MKNSAIHFAIVGPSGAGKTTAVETLKREFPGLELQKQENYTTRSLRPEEIARGESDYIHISNNEFRIRKNRGEFIGDKLGKGKNHLGKREIQNYGGTAPRLNRTVFITDPTGLGMLKQRAQKYQEQIIAIFLHASSAVCQSRMAAERGEEVATTRTKQYDTYMKGAPLCDYSIDAERSKEEVAKELYDILNKEILRHSYPTELF